MKNDYEMRNSWTACQKEMTEQIGVKCAVLVLLRNVIQWKQWGIMQEQKVILAKYGQMYEVQLLRVVSVTSKEQEVPCVGVVSMYHVHQH
jgi:hypothetical protein